jgi:hypothetical protein
VKSAPAQVAIDGKPATDAVYDAASGTLLLRFANTTSPKLVEVRF